MRRGGRFGLTLSRGQPGPPWAPWGGSVFLHRSGCPLAVVPAGCGPHRLETGQWHPPPQSPGAPAGLRTVGVSEKPDPCLVPRHWGHTKASHLDSEKNSQVMCPVKPKEAFLGSHGEPLAEGRRAQADPPEEALSGLSPPGHTGPAGSCGEAVLKVWSSARQPHRTRHLEEYVFLGRTSDLPGQTLWAQGSALCVLISSPGDSETLDLENFRLK